MRSLYGSRNKNLGGDEESYYQERRKVDWVYQVKSNKSSNPRKQQRKERGSAREKTLREESPRECIWGDRSYRKKDRKKRVHDSGYLGKKKKG